MREKLQTDTRRLRRADRQARRSGASRRPEGVRAARQGAALAGPARREGARVLSACSNSSTRPERCCAPRPTPEMKEFAAEEIRELEARLPDARGRAQGHDAAERPERRQGHHRRDPRRAPAATRRRSSPATSTACTRATPSCRSGRSRRSTRPRATRAASRRSRSAFAATRSTRR